MKKFWSLIRRAIYIVLLLTIIILLEVAKKDSDFAEKMMRTVVRGYGKGATVFSSLVPFLSLTEVLFLFLFSIGVLLLVLTIIDLVKLRIIKAANKVILIPVIALFVVTLYDFSCEAAYNRHQMPLPYYQQEVERDDFSKIYNYFTDDMNNVINQLSFKDNGDVEGQKLADITKEVKEAYKIVTDSYFHPYLGSVKPMLSSFVYREFQITGVTFSPLGEANINTMNVNADIPFTVAHELAHTKGVMKEDDANQLAFYVCINSNNPYLKYSAYTRYYSQIQMMISKYYLTQEQFDAASSKPDEHYNKTISYEADYWSKHDLLGDIGEWFNNLYIKKSGVKEGTKSYNIGTTQEYDPATNKFYPSQYQKLFIEKYYRENI